jgi:hypothetical protein
MTVARIACRKAARLTHRPSAWKVPACVVAPHPRLSAHAKATLQRPFRSASCLRSTVKVQVLPTRACSINRRHDPRDD